MKTCARVGVCSPLLKCVFRDEGRRLLEEINARICSSHIRTRALVGKAFREGFYWPSAIANAHEVVRTCPNCQRHTPYSKSPPPQRGGGLATDAMGRRYHWSPISGARKLQVRCSGG